MTRIDHVTSADGTRIACETFGTGRWPLVFVHGAAGARMSETRLLTALGERFRVTTYDRRGRGDSGDGPAYGFLRESDDLRAVIAAVDRPPVVLGISMGARVALEMLRAPLPLRCMILFEPPATAAPDPGFSTRLDELRHVLDQDGPEAATILHSRHFHRRSDAEIAELRTQTEAWARRVQSFPVTLREMEAVHRDCLLDLAQLHRPAFPVHLMIGGATLPFLTHSADQIRALDFIRVHDLPGQTHSAPRTAPEAVLAVVDEVTKALG